MTTKKIIIEKEDGVSEVVDRILGEPDPALVLVIPRGSVLGKSARNFTLMQREAVNSGKEIFVESVDENILAFAKNAGIAVNHPLLRERSTPGMSGISDIIPISRQDGTHGADSEDETYESQRSKKQSAGSRRLVPKEETVSEEIMAEKGAGYGESAGLEDVEREEQSFFKEENLFFKKRQIPAMDESENEEETSRERVITWRRTLWIFAGLVVLAIALYVTTAVFGSAKISIAFKKTPWGYNKNFIAEQSVSKIDAANNILPAQTFSVQKNIAPLFPASGEQNVSLKAQGIITIYNAYSSSPQKLVATTRFVTPDGKIFRLVSAVTVPGAAVTNGKIVPSSIDTAIVADQPGPDYNVSSTPKLTIPGFKGSPKYDAFYGSIASSTSGGFIGQKAVPTADDITSAKQKVADILASALQNSLTGSYTNNFKILDGATNIQITKITVNSSTDENGKFSVFGEGTLSAIGFDETAFKTFLLSLAQSVEASSTWSADPSLTYTNVKPDFTNGKLSFSLNVQGSLEPVFSVDDFRRNVAGKKISDTKDVVASLPELQEGTISVWPAWLWQIPTNTNRIQVIVD